jgi:hypothetical protein
MQGVYCREELYRVSTVEVTCKLFIYQQTSVFGRTLTGAFRAHLTEYCINLLFDCLYVTAYFSFLFCYIVVTLCSV